MARYAWFAPGPANAWTSLDELRRGMDEWFSRYGDRPEGPSAGVFPPVNLYEVADGYVLTAELPGVSPKDIEVSVEQGKVTLSGDRRVELPEGVSLHRRERQTGGFRRALQLPVEVNADKAEATHRNGVLMLRLPKAPEHRPRRIDVATG